MSERFAAWRFDGRTADARAASLSVDGADFVIESPESADVLRVPIAQARVSEPFEHAPRMVYAGSGQTFQVSDGPGFTRAIEAAGFRVSPVVRLQRNWPLALGALPILVAALASAYLYGLPVAARWAADATPPALQERMGSEVLDVLDRNFLAPSALPEATMAEIKARFASAALRSAPDHPVRLEFRTMKSEEPQEEAGEVGGDAVEDAPADEPDPTINAFSLPGGTIIVLDGLVEATDPNEIFAVLGHELGHVVHAHGMRQLFQSTGAVVLAGLAWGDFSGVAAGVPTALGVLRYDRAFERESDDFAVRFLLDDGLGADPLCRFFELVLELEQESGFDGIPEFLSTHPETSERLVRICPWRSAPAKTT